MNLTWQTCSFPDEVKTAAEWQLQQNNAVSPHRNIQCLSRSLAMGLGSVHLCSQPEPTNLVLERKPFPPPAGHNMPDGCDFTISCLIEAILGREGCGTALYRRGASTSPTGRGSS